MKKITNSSFSAITSNYCFNSFQIENSFTNSEREIWDFTSRQEMQEIIPGLYLGPYLAAKRSRLNKLIEAGITHIVCVRHESEAAMICVNFPDEFKYLEINFLDGNIIPVFPKVNDFIDNCFRSGGKVLVHGNLGNSRSAALVIAYLMEAKALSYSEACSLVQSKRYCIHIQDTFINQLKEYEPIYKARSTHSRGHTSKFSGNQGKLKRRFDEVIDTESSSLMEIYEEDS